MISDANKNIDYKLAAAQRYKNELIKKAELIISKTNAVAMNQKQVTEI